MDADEQTLEQLDQGSGARHEDSHTYCASAANPVNEFDDSKDCPKYAAEVFMEGSVSFCESSAAETLP